MRILALVIALASLAIAEDAPKSDAPAEALVKKLEERIASAKTVSIRIKFEAAKTMFKRRTSMTYDVDMDFKEGNRARFHWVLPADARQKETESTVICDGKKLHGYGETRGVEKDAADRAKAMFVRYIHVEAIRALGEAPEPAEFSEWAFLPDEKVGDRTLKVVSVTVTRRKMAVAMKLWIDADKLELVKRELYIKAQDEILTETFTSMKIDGDIPDDTFKAPEKKEEK